MPKFSAINRDQHAAKKWRRFDSYRFAAQSAATPIVAAELPSVIPTMPVVFIEQGGQLELSALLSVTSGTNMFVAPDGRWLGTYVPAYLRAYPFRLLKPQGADEPVLCIDDESGLVGDGTSPGEDFFQPDGNISPALKAAVDLLTELERSRILTSLAVSSLAQAGVIQPWPLVVKDGQGDRTVNGLYRIDEAALNALPTEDFVKLRATGAIPIAYAQLLSMAQLNVFGHLTRLQAQLAPKPVQPLPDTLDKLFDRSNNEYLRFD